MTGIAPHQGITAEVLLKVLSEEPRSLSDLRPDLAPWLVSFVHRLLEKDPSRRPYDATVLIQQLSQDAKASGLLVNKAAVARWIANLFEEEKAEEMEERERLALGASGVEVDGLLRLALEGVEQARLADPTGPVDHHDAQVVGGLAQPSQQRELGPATDEPRRQTLLLLLQERRAHEAASLRNHRLSTRRSVASESRRR